MSYPPTGTVTFLFTDIEGSTALWEQRPQAMQTALARHHAILGGVAAQHHGHVFQIVGDAFCIAFASAPDAMLAALAAQRALRAEPWAETGPLRVRMALHTGAAELQDGQYRSNRTFNRISRLLAAGYGGQILLTLATEELIRDHLPVDVSLRDVGERRMRDVVHPEHLFQLVALDLPAEFPPLKLPRADTSAGGEPDQDSSRSLSDRSRRATLVGRTEVLRRMTDRLGRLLSGQGGMLAVSGEPGIGKSRLLDEMIAGAHRHGLQVLIGRCHEGEIAIPYAPLTQALESFARSCTPDKWQQLLDAAGPEIHVLLPNAATFATVMSASIVRSDLGAYIAAESDHFHPARAARNLLVAASRAAPVLLVLDDLHWADAATLDLIHDVALHTDDLPILLVGSYREMELERAHPLSKLLMDLNRERLLVREPLRRLSPPETRELLAALLSGEPPPGFSELVAEQTEGNPFFVEELVTSLVDDRRLAWDEQKSRYELAAGVSVESLAGQVPQGIRGTIGARLDQLDAVVNRALGLASIIGRQFSLELLSGLAAGHDLSADELEQALARAEAAHFISAIGRSPHGHEPAAGPKGDTDYTFDHALIHQVVYSEIDRRQRRRLHSEVGHQLEEIYKEREGYYAERIAYHYLESDEDALAIQYSLLAGDKMFLEYYDTDMALAYYLPALEMAAFKDNALRRIVRKSPVATGRGMTHRFNADEREAVVSYLGDVVRAVRDPEVSKAVAQLASRICVVAMHTGEVYEASIRLYEQALLGPDVQKLVVAAARGSISGILEFPGPGGPYPVVLFCHGVPSGREAITVRARRFLARGLAILCIDLPGYGESTVPLAQSPADAEALVPVIDALCAHGRIDPSRVGVVGLSDGGWHAAQLCARDKRIRAMIGVSGRYSKLDGPEHIIAAGPGEEAFRVARWKAGGRPTLDPFPWSLDSAVYDVAEQIRCPMLLLVGSVEPEIFRRQAAKLASLVPSARLQTWRNGVHGLGNVPEALESAADWMKEQLTMAAGPAAEGRQ